MHLDSTHRYKNLSALLFYEMLHWLGHSHSDIKPDATILYEACSILRDDELWCVNNYQKVRLWHYKGYDLVKCRVREDAE